MPLLKVALTTVNQFNTSVASMAENGYGFAVKKIKNSFPTMAAWTIVLHGQFVTVYCARFYVPGSKYILKQFKRNSEI